MEVTKLEGMVGKIICSKKTVGQIKEMIEDGMNSHISFEVASDREDRVVRVIHKLDLVRELIAPPEIEDGTEHVTTLTNDILHGALFVLDEVREVLEENIDPICYKCEERREHGEKKH